MAEQKQQHYLVEMTDAIAEDPTLVGVEGDLNVEGERAEQPGDVGVDALEAIMEDPTELTTTEKERIVKIINLIGDKRGKTGQEVLLKMLTPTEEETEEQPPAA